ncbi:MAG: FixH family protein [Granulosicoccus sp.]
MSTIIASQNELCEQSLPWYRYGWPWFLISIPLVSVCLGSGMLYLALNANNSLVVDDYYKEGKAYNVRIERDRLASVLGLDAVVTQSSEGLVLELGQDTPKELPEGLESDALSAELAFEMPDSLRLRWVHVTQETRDGDTTLQFIGASRYIAPGVTLPVQGKFRLHIEPMRTILENEGQAMLSEGDWRLTSKLVGFESRQAINIRAPEPHKVFSRDLFQ